MERHLDQPPLTSVTVASCWWGRAFDSVRRVVHGVVMSQCVKVSKWYWMWYLIEWLFPRMFNRAEFKTIFFIQIKGISVILINFLKYNYTHIFISLQKSTVEICRPQQMAKLLCREHRLGSQQHTAAIRDTRPLAFSLESARLQGSGQGRHLLVLVSLRSFHSEHHHSHTRFVELLVSCICDLVS